MSFENCHVSASGEKCNESNAEGRFGTSGSNESSEELQDCQDIKSEREDSGSTVCGKPEDCSDENEASVTTTFLNGNAKIAIAPKIAESSLNQSAVRNQILRPDNQLDEKENETAGDEIETAKGGSLKKGAIYAIDCFVAAIIVGPMVVAHWRGIWVLMDFHANIFSGWLCFGAGMSLHLLFAVLKHPLHRIFAAGAKGKGPCGRLGRRLVRTLYTYAFSLACNCHWRGAWILLNDWFGVQAGVIVCFTCAILGDLIVLRCIRNLMAPPFLVTLDSPRFVFQFPTRYRALEKI